MVEQVFKMPSIWALLKGILRKVFGLFKGWDFFLIDKFKCEMARLTKGDGLLF
jgi:hypothetical protein